MNKLLNVFNSKKVGFLAVFAASAVFTLALVFVPRIQNLIKANYWDCSNPPTVATFNPYMPTDDGSSNDAGTGCRDFPTISIRNVNGTQGQFYNSINAQAGDTLYVRVWVHNGASDTIDRSGTIAHNVQGQISVSGNSISTNFSGTTANGAIMGGNNSGSVYVNMPSGASLQVVEGSGQIYGGGSINTNQSGANFNIGDQDACFGFARQIYIQVKVVPQAAAATGNISGQIHSDNQACRVYGSVNWNTSNTSGLPVVKIQDTTDNSSKNVLFSGAYGNNSDFGSDWLKQGHNYKFYLYSQDGGDLLDSTNDLLVPTLNCGGTTNPPAQPVVKSFNASLGQCISAGLVSGNVNWDTEGFDEVQIKVSADNGTPTPFRYQPEGNETINDWIIPGHLYTFTMVTRVNNGFYYTQGSKDIDARNANCGGGQNPSTPTGGIDVTDGGKLTNGQCLSRGIVTWNSQNFRGSPEVDVTSDGVTKAFSGDILNGTQNADFINPGQTYVFKLIDLGTNTVVATKTYVGPQLSCGGSTQTYTATATASATATCPNGSFASASGYGTATSNISQADANSKAYANAQANAQAQASVNCPSNPGQTLTCPSAQVQLTRDLIFQGESTVASAPAGFSGGYFESNFRDVTQTGNTFTANYNALGSTLVVGKNWTYTSGGQSVSGCFLNGAPLEIRAQQSNACVQRNFNTSTSGLFVNGSRVDAQLSANQNFTVSCDYGVKSARITLEGNGANGCGFAGWNGNAAQFSCVTPSQTGSYSVSCRMTNNVSEDNSCSSLNPVGSYNVNVNIPNLVCSTLTPSVYTTQNASFSASGGNGSYSWSNGGSPQTGNGSSFNTNFANSGSYYVTVQSGSQTVTCPVVTVIKPQVSAVSCELAPGSSSVVDFNQSVSFRASGGNGTYAFNASGANPATQNASTNNSFTTQYPSTSGSGQKFVNVISDGQVASCPIVTVREPVQTLTCSALNSPIAGDPAYFTASGGNGTYSWSNGGSPQTGSGANFSTTYNSDGTKTVQVQSGSQTASCNVVVKVRPNVCVQNTNVSLTRGDISSDGSTFRTSIFYSFSGQNSVKLTYIDPVDGQEKALVASASASGVQVVSGIQPNKDYIFKLYDNSSCGGLLQTLIVRKDVSTACISNSNFAINFGTPVKEGSTYGVDVTWTSTGSHGIKLAQDSVGNIIKSGSASGSTRVSGLVSGSTHTFYIIDDTCGNTLAAGTIQMPTETTSTGNCNNSNNSCNNNTNTNTGTNNNSTNSSNQNNNSNINGNNNTVSQTNNNCVNNSCNTYYISGGNTVNSNDYRQLSIQKLVRNITSGSYQSFQDSVSANNGDLVEFQITVRSVGNQTVNNVVLTDILPSGLSFTSGQLNGQQNLGSMFANDTRTITFQARVNSGSTLSMQNIARVSGDGVSQVQDDAWVFATVGCTYNCGSVQGSSINLNYSKKAINETKATYAGQQVDATSVNASREDYITYTLTVTNTGNAPANNFVITDDLSQVLPYADMVDNGGGSLNGNVINFPGLTVPAGGSVSKSFKVRVKYGLASNLSYTMTNTYGNTLNIRINNPAVLGAFIAPKTGADTVGITFATLLTLAFAGYKKKELLSKLILNN